MHFLVSHALSRFASWSRSDEAYYPQVSSHQCRFQHYQDSPSTNDNAPFYHCCCCVFWFNMQWVIHSKVLDMWKNLASRSPLPRNTLDLDCANVGCVVPIFFSIQNPLFNVPFVADVLSDILLIGIPVRMLWRTRLPNNQRILILSIFATSIMMTCISIVHNIALFRNEIFQIVITGYLEVCSSHLSLTFITPRQFCQAAIGLIVCNLLVVVTWVYRLLRNGEELEASTTEDASSRPPMTPVVTDAPMTTISFTDVSGMHTFDTNTDHSFIQDDSATHGNNSAAGSHPAMIQSSYKND